MSTQEKHRHYINFDIAGFTYWDGALVLCDLKPGKKFCVYDDDFQSYVESAIMAD